MVIMNNIYTEVNRLFNLVAPPQAFGPEVISHNAEVINGLAEKVLKGQMSLKEVKEYLVTQFKDIKLNDSRLMESLESAYGKDVVEKARQDVETKPYDITERCLFHYLEKMEKAEELAGVLTDYRQFDPDHDFLDSSLNVHKGFKVKFLNRIYIAILQICGYDFNKFKVAQEIIRRLGDRNLVNKVLTDDDRKLVQRSLNNLAKRFRILNTESEGLFRECIASAEELKSKDPEADLIDQNSEAEKTTGVFQAIKDRFDELDAHASKKTHAQEEAVPENQPKLPIGDQDEYCRFKTLFLGAQEETFALQKDYLSKGRYGHLLLQALMNVLGPAKGQDAMNRDDFEALSREDFNDVRNECIKLACGENALKPKAQASSGWSFAGIKEMLGGIMQAESVASSKLNEAKIQSDKEAIAAQNTLYIQRTNQERINALMKKHGNKRVNEALVSVLTELRRDEIKNHRGAPLTPKEEQTLDQKCEQLKLKADFEQRLEDVKNKLNVDDALFAEAKSKAGLTVHSEEKDWVSFEKKLEYMKAAKEELERYGKVLNGKDFVKVLLEAGFHIKDQESTETRTALQKILDGDSRVPPFASLLSKISAGLDKYRYNEDDIDVCVDKAKAVKVFIDASFNPEEANKIIQNALLKLGVPKGDLDAPEKIAVAIRRVMNVVQSRSYKGHVGTVLAPSIGLNKFIDAIKAEISNVKLS